jgi:hypothetical protein
VSALYEDIALAWIRGCRPDWLLDRWQVPDRTEAHRVTYVVDGEVVDFGWPDA